jgi:hypothetical protein
MLSPPSRTTLYSLVDTVSIDTVSITDTIGVMKVSGERGSVRRVEAYSKRKEVRLGGRDFVAQATRA